MSDLSRGLQVVRAGIGQYLSEAAAAIFSPQTSDVPWDGSTSGWSGGEAERNVMVIPRSRYVLAMHVPTCRLTNS
jgi:hypothetical protein